MPWLLKQPAHLANKLTVGGDRSRLFIVSDVGDPSAMCHLWKRVALARWHQQLVSRPQRLYDCRPDGCEESDLVGGVLVNRHTFSRLRCAPFRARLLAHAFERLANSLRPRSDTSRRVAPRAVANSRAQIPPRRHPGDRGRF